MSDADALRARVDTYRPTEACRALTRAEFVELVASYDTVPEAAADLRMRPRSLLVLIGYHDCDDLILGASTDVDWDRIREAAVVGGGGGE